MQLQQIRSKQHDRHLLLACEGMSGQVLLVWALAPLIYWGVCFLLLLTYYHSVPEGSRVAFGGQQ